jgi:hypothetical protein
MVGLGTRSTIERVEIGNSRPKAARASALPDSDEERGEFDTQTIDRRFEALVEHIPHHDHAAWHPLPSSTQFRVVELGHRAMTMHQGLEQSLHRFRTNTITLGESRDFLLSFRRQL